MSDPFRSLTTTLFDWPQVEGVLREIGEFKPCSMCEKEVKLGRLGQPEFSNVHYGGEPTCLVHARLLPELHRKARYSRAVLDKKRAEKARPSEVLDHDFVWEEEDGEDEEAEG